MANHYYKQNCKRQKKNNNCCIYSKFLITKMQRRNTVFAMSIDDTVLMKRARSLENEQSNCKKGLETIIDKISTKYTGLQTLETLHNKDSQEDTQQCIRILKLLSDLELEVKYLVWVLKG